MKKKALMIIVLTIVTVSMLFVGCSKQSADTSTTDNSSTTTTESTTTEPTASPEDDGIDEPMVIDLEELYNAEADGKPMVEINGDDGSNFEFDISKLEEDKVELTTAAPKDDYFYVIMTGNVTSHTLDSDGSLFDGIAEVNDGKAEFSVTYDDERTIEFIINVK